MSYAYDAPDWLNVEGDLILNLSGGHWEWDVVDVWKRKADGRLFMYAEGGCSCSYAYQGLDDGPAWEKLTPLTDVQVFLSAIDSSYFIDLKADKVIQHAATVSRAIADAS